MKRVVLLTDDEIERVLSWYAAVEWYQGESSVPAGDLDDEDDAVAAKLRAARLA